MNKVTLTLELTYDQVLAVVGLLSSTATEAISELSSPKLTLPDALPTSTKEVLEKAPTVVKPTAGKGITMPSFGRTQAQVDAAAANAQERLDSKNEEALEKAQRKVDRDIAKASKDAAAKVISDEKTAKAKKAADEIAAIKKADLSETTAPLAVKPWAL